MTYVVNVDDPSTPNDLQDAMQGAEELRAIKAKLNTLVPGASSNISQVRQTVLSGPLTAGVPSLVSVDSGLNLKMDGSVTPAILSFAAGFSNIGSYDWIEQVTNLRNNYWAMPASNNTFIALDRASAGALSAFTTIAPPQFKEFYNRSAQSVLQFAGAAGATTFLDDFGNTWSIGGGAPKVQVDKFKFGTGGLGGGGAVNSLNGTTDFIRSTEINTLGLKSWAIRCWVNPSALPAPGEFRYFGGVHNATPVGALLAINNNAGTIRFMYSLSSDGTSNNIASNVQGTTLPVVGTWYFVELTFDAVAGVYRLYVNGTQEASTVSGLRLCGSTEAFWGFLTGGGTGLNCYIDKPEILPYCQHPAGTAYGVPTTAPNVAAAGYASDFFDCTQWKMKQVTGASSAAGTDPTFGDIQRLYIGDADSNAAAITTLRNYAYQGKYINNTSLLALALSTVYNFTHNIGVKPRQVSMKLRCISEDAGYRPGEEIEGFGVHTSNANNNGFSYTADDRGIVLATASTNVSVIPRTGGAAIVLTVAKWAFSAYANRGI